MLLYQKNTNVYDTRGEMNDVLGWFNQLFVMHKKLPATRHDIEENKRNDSYLKIKFLQKSAVYWHFNIRNDFRNLKINKNHNRFTMYKDVLNQLRNPPIYENK